MLNDIYQSLDPVALTLGPLQIRWYGLAYIFGFILAGLLLVHLSRRWKLKMSEDSIYTVLMCIVLGIILGARIGYCLFYGDGYYLAHPLKILAINEGGMSFHGGLLGVLIGGFVASRITHVPFATLTDLGAVMAPLGLFLGRCANFVNGELWGGPTDLPWGVVFGGVAGNMPRHPSQLYEAVLEGLVLFAILYCLARRNPPHPRGTYIGTFLLGYGVFRFLIEFIRQPDAQIGYLLGDWFTMGQLLSLPLVVAGVALLIYARVKKLPQQGEPEGE
ncbi:prolipoprotein diacylglyceryl transferase [Slackia heliotrinireducens]|uniref:Phosphatidylglycerol--prolipoprotein diacylglyceryl transferase n=1 Tax=Slackia heliotrinireducens (strain ATCC 29202 / DSM 20476 / NCTC 11029 / RHS 1) TaxID=471855 RepID=C7N6K0_SLAHD|nr:prolipoprotein diacylglyceryl transferase [Slackia heliotrinireducens]ACV22535.1 prolipoprotein diacylglyceryl transferase [Slackia heliotrinireducens DSM 20476]VEH00985.1 Prolipoprotein diacylglyceryl transferase [Slackia heliotrinireducens]